jgi:multiple antibiotic resistance protein
MGTPSWVNSFVMTLVPLFIVIDAVGTLPFVVSLSEGMERRERRRLINTAIATAAIVGLFFLFVGQALLNVMGISVGSFAIAGGIILLTLSLQFMITGRMVEIVQEEIVAVVPIGTPLTVGPATVTTLLLLATQYSIQWVLLSFVINIGIVYLIFSFSHQVVRVLGKAGVKAVSRIAALLLAAIAVDMVIRGLELIGVLHLAA